MNISELRIYCNKISRIAQLLTNKVLYASIHVTSAISATFTLEAHMKFVIGAILWLTPLVGTFCSGFYAANGNTVASVVLCVASLGFLKFVLFCLRKHSEKKANNFQKDFLEGFQNGVKKSFAVEGMSDFEKDFLDGFEKSFKESFAAEMRHTKK